MNSGLDMIWKEEVLAQPTGTEENHKNSVMIVTGLAEIQLEDLLNTNLDDYR